MLGQAGGPGKWGVGRGELELPTLLQRRLHPALLTPPTGGATDAISTLEREAVLHVHAIHAMVSVWPVVKEWEPEVRIVRQIVPVPNQVRVTA